MSSSVSVGEILEVVKGLKKSVPRKYVREASRKNEFPRKLFDAMRDAGLLGVGVPEELGGTGGGVTEAAALQEALYREGLGYAYPVLAGMVRAALIEHGTDAQKQKYVVPATTGEKLLCFAITEPNAGTNTTKIETLARRTPNGYRINGQKTFITGFTDADYCLLVARTTPYKEVTSRTDGISLFMLDTKAKGITATRQDLRLDVPEAQFQLYFDDVEIPAEDLVGKEGKGLKSLFNALNPERLIGASMFIGIGQFVLTKAIEYAKIRAPFDTPIGAYQSVHHALAYAHVRLESARLMRDKGCMLYDSGGECGAEANMAKLIASDAALEALTIAMQVHGGSSVDAETDIAGFLPLVNLGRIAPVNNLMILNHVGQHVLGLPKAY